MDHTAPHSARTEPPAPSQEDRAATAMPTCIAAILSVVRVLLGYGKHLDQTLPAQADHPRFPTLAAGFGTHDVRRILAHVQRGILRAMMLERFLLARADQGRDIEPTEPPVPAEAADIEAMEVGMAVAGRSSWEGAGGSVRAECGAVLSMVGVLTLSVSFVKGGWGRR